MGLRCINMWQTKGVQDEDELEAVFADERIAFTFLSNQVKVSLGSAIEC